MSYSERPRQMERMFEMRQVESRDRRFAYAEVMDRVLPRPRWTVAVVLMILSSACSQPHDVNADSCVELLQRADTLDPSGPNFRAAMSAIYSRWQELDCSRR